MSHSATEDAHYPDGVTLKEVWDAMRAAAEAETYKVAHQIAIDRKVEWMCSVCVERHVGDELEVPLPLKPEHVRRVAMTHDDLTISVEIPKEHYSLPVCKICYDAWKLTFVSQQYLRRTVDEVAEEYMFKRPNEVDR